MIVHMILPILAGAAVTAITAAYLTNPFTRYSIIRLPFRAHIKQRALLFIDNNHKLTVRNSYLWRVWAIVKSGIYILTTRYIDQDASRSTTVSEIIRDIHTLRFDPDKLLLISGDHFNSLFVRNLGVFYYPMLDRRIKGSEEDWQRRQIVYMQTVAYALGVYALDPTPTTTIVPTGPYGATCVDFYTHPSDTVFGIFFALAALAGKEDSAPTNYAKIAHPLDTRDSAHELIDNYEGTLRALYDNYSGYAFDPASGLVSTSIHMSGAKDITKRNSAFYDNVVYWKTTELAMNLGVIPRDKPFLAALKKKILETYWYEEGGYFLEDQSPECLDKKYYSSDWLIVLSTRFLDPTKPTEQHYFTHSIDYIDKYRIARPFAIKYQQSTRAHRQFFIVRLAVASYGGDAIWSFWGMEYIKLLCILHKSTGEERYKKEAAYHLKKYRKNIIKYRGFPEVYDHDGDLLKTPLYKSIRMTGWVIGFEQAEAMYKHLVGELS